MAISTEAQAKVQLLRQKAREGTLTPAEAKEAIIMLRQDRTFAQATSTKAKAAKAKPSGDDLLSELEGL